MCVWFFFYQWGLQISFSEPEPAGLLYKPPAGAAVSLRRWPGVGERYRNVHAVGQRQSANGLEGNIQDSKGRDPTGRGAERLLQGWAVKCETSDPFLWTGQDAWTCERHFSSWGYQLFLDEANMDYNTHHSSGGSFSERCVLIPVCVCLLYLTL